MVSWQARLIVPFLQWKVKRVLRAQPDVATVRKVLGGVEPPISQSIAATPETIADVPGEWSRPLAGSPPGTMLYIHGGGFMACSFKTHRPITTAFAKAGLAVFAPDYRLAPENPFPAGLDDVVAVYLALLGRAIPASRIVVAGDSAGGNLAMALMLRLRDLGAPLPAAAMLFSPWTDLACTGASLETNGRRCAMFDGPMLRSGVPVYLNDGDPKVPLASPLYADLHGLPQMRIHVSSSESLFDDSTRLAAKARAAGVACGLRQWPVVPHAWQLLGFLPEARESMAEAAAFLLRALAQAPAPERLRIVTS